MELRGDTVRYTAPKPGLMTLVGIRTAGFAPLYTTNAGTTQAGPLPPKPALDTSFPPLENPARMLDLVTYPV